MEGPEEEPLATLPVPSEAPAITTNGLMASAESPEREIKT